MKALFLRALILLFFRAFLFLCKQMKTDEIMAVFILFVSERVVI